jgi:general secretion pathway protein K
MNRLHREEGTVLLVVLVLVVLLTTLLGEFAFSTLVDLRTTESFRDRTRAYYLAKGGIRVGRMILQDDRNGYDAAGELWSQGISGYPVGEGQVSIAIEDLDGRINLNLLVTTQGNTDVVVKDRLLRLLVELDIAEGPELVDALIDWLDPDSDPEPKGAEDDYYESLAPVVPAKNGPLDDFGELSRVRGFSPDIIDRLAPHAAVRGSSLINVNTASAEVLTALADEMERETAETIIAARQATPLTSVARLKELPGLESRYGFIFRYLKVTSNTYRVHARAEVGGGISNLEADIRKKGDKILYLKVD